MPEIRNLVAGLRPRGWPYHPSRVLVYLLAFGGAMLAGRLLHNANVAYLACYGVYATLYFDAGDSRLHRLESMVIGVSAIILCLSASTILGAWPLAWWGMLAILLLVTGYCLSAGFAIEILLRLSCVAWLLAEPPSRYGTNMLCWFIVGAVLCAALGLLLTPGRHTMQPFPEVSFWRKDLRKIRQGQHAGWKFGWVWMLTMLVCTAIPMYLKLPFAYSVPIAALMVLYPDAARMKTTTWHRIAGVLAALLLLLPILFMCHSHALVSVLIVIAGALFPLAFAGGVFYLITDISLLIFLLQLLRISPQADLLFAEAKVLETLAGALVAIAVFCLWEYCCTRRNSV